MGLMIVSWTTQPTEGSQVCPLPNTLPLNKPTAPLSQCLWLGSDSLMAPSSHLS